MLSIKCLILCFIPVMAELNHNIHVFYYPWYSAPPTSQNWTQWNGERPGVLDHNPTDGDIASNYYPVLGAYDSCDSKVLAKHMQWISEAGIGTIISSWRGIGSIEDRCVSKIMDAADKYQIKVGFHLEPYAERTTQSVVKDIKYVNESYGKHSAYFRDSKFGERDVFYVYRISNINDWSAIDPLKKDHIILAQTTNQSTEHFSGFYTYAIGGDHKVVELWRSMNNFCKSNGLIWSPSIGPGFIDKRARPKSIKIDLDRDNGQTYENNWAFVFYSGIPHYVSITSFNEWAQGSMIEPASSDPPKGSSYMKYEGAYNKTGTGAENAYLERTAFWVKEFTKISR